MSDIIHVYRLANSVDDKEYIGVCHAPEMEGSVGETLKNVMAWHKRQFVHYLLGRVGENDLHKHMRKVGFRNYRIELIRDIVEDNDNSESSISDEGYAEMRRIEKDLEKEGRLLKEACYDGLEKEYGDSDAFSCWICEKRFHRNEIKQHFESDEHTAKK